MEQTFWYNDPAMDHLPFPPSSALASCMQPPRLPVHHFTASRVSDLKHRIPPPELFFFVPGKSTLYSRAEAASGRHRPHPPLVWRMPAPRPRRQPFLILLSSFFFPLLICLRSAITAWASELFLVVFSRARVGEILCELHTRRSHSGLDACPSGSFLFLLSFGPVTFSWGRI